MRQKSQRLKVTRAIENAAFVLSIWITDCSLANAAALNLSSKQLQAMIAASPARELARAWGKCIDDARALALLNQIPEAKRIETFAYASCEEWESRLTGELVKRHGLAKADAAIRAIRQRFKPGFEETARQVTAKPEGFVAQVGGWTVVRLPNGHCVAKISDGRLINPNATALGLDQGEWRLWFIKNVSYSARYESRRGQLEAIDLAAFGGNQPTKTARRQFRFEVASDFIGWTMPMSDAVAQKLASADRVQFQALPEEQYVARVFPTTGLNAAWTAVKDCEERRAK